MDAVADMHILELDFEVIENRAEAEPSASNERFYNGEEYWVTQQEWYNHRQNDDNKGSKILISEPFLISELNRLVPYVEDNLVKFHPLNMPHLKIGKIEVVGFVIDVKEDSRFYELLVDDGTGMLIIFYEKELFEAEKEKRQKIHEKYQRQAAELRISNEVPEKEPKFFPNPRPNFVYPEGTALYDIAILEHNWWLETKHGLLGKKVEQFNYIHAVGYCVLDFQFGKKHLSEITFENLLTAKLNFRATSVNCILEEEYNVKLIKWMSSVMQKRYESPQEPHT